jgi:hypothetical protein
MVTKFRAVSTERNTRNGRTGSHSQSETSLIEQVNKELEAVWNASIVTKMLNGNGKLSMVTSLPIFASVAWKRLNHTATVRCGSSN